MPDQARLATGRMALRDGGQQLRAAVEDNAAELVAALQALAAAGRAEPPWNAAAFHGAALRFIDPEGRPQVHACPALLPPLAAQALVFPSWWAVAE